MFVRFDLKWYVGRGWWVLPDRIQGQGHGGLKVAKMVDFKVSSFSGMHAIESLTVNYDTPRQYLNLSGQVFDIRPLSASCDLYISAVLEISNDDISGMGGLQWGCVTVLQGRAENEQTQEELPWSNGHCEQVWSWCYQVGIRVVYLFHSLLVLDNVCLLHECVR